MPLAQVEWEGPLAAEANDGGLAMETTSDHQIAATVDSVGRTAVSIAVGSCWPSLS